MLGRNIVALITGRTIPILQNPMYTFYYALIWYLINKFPGDLIYKILKSAIFYIPLQFIMALTAIREVTCGITIGNKEFPASVVGAIGVSFILSCTESVVWCSFFDEVREYSTATIARNMIAAGLYVFFTQYSQEYFDFSVSAEEEKIYSMFVFFGFVLLNDLFLGLRSDKSFGRGLIRMLNVLPYHGSDFISSK